MHIGVRKYRSLSFQMKIKIYLAIWIIPSIIVSCGEHSIETITLDEAHQQYFQMNTSKAFDYYQHIWEESNFSIKDKAEAGRMLAKMFWLLHGKTSQALERLKSLDSLDYDATMTYRLWSRILRSEKKFKRAIEIAEKSLSAATSETELYYAELTYVKAVLEKFEEDQFESNNLITNISESADLQKASQIINKIMVGKPGDVVASDLALGVNLLTKNWDAAYRAWLSFYRFNNQKAVHKTMVSAHNKLAEVLLGLDSLKSEESIISVIEALSASGFIEYASLVSYQFSSYLTESNPEINDIRLYYYYMQDLRKITLNLYRQTVNGNVSKGSYKSDFYDLGEKLWSKLSWPGEIPSFGNEKFKAEIRKRFNTIYEFKNANGHFGLNMGHVVLDDKRLIKQHGKTADLRYIAIDHMVSNGYSSWYWDGLAAIGGWAGKDYFLQVRTAYNKGPVEAWLMVSDSSEREKTMIEISSKSRQDDLIAGKNPYAYLPGLSLRITFNTRNGILDSLKSRGLKGGDLRISFINIIENRARKSSIFAHEGRHAIDNIYSGPMKSSEEEFRAKLSEIYFSGDPFLGLRGIMHENIGDGTSHGKANLKVLKGIVGWMDDHKEEIQGFDIERPTLPQLDILNASQLRDAVRTIDPMVN